MTDEYDDDSLVVCQVQQLTPNPQIMGRVLAKRDGSINAGENNNNANNTNNKNSSSNGVAAFLESQSRWNLFFNDKPLKPNNFINEHCKNNRWTFKSRPIQTIDVTNFVESLHLAEERTAMQDNVAILKQISSSNSGIFIKEETQKRDPNKFHCVVKSREFERDVRDKDETEIDFTGKRINLDLHNLSFDLVVFVHAMTE